MIKEERLGLLDDLELFELSNQDQHPSIDRRPKPNRVKNPKEVLPTCEGIDEQLATFCDKTP
jgi:hypothetical protein